MANKPVDMSKLKQVLRLYKNGDMSNRKIAETVETIRFLPIAWWEAMQPIQMPDLTS